MASAMQPEFPNAQLLPRLLETMEQDILPLTQKGVALGNKIFGAAYTETLLRNA